MNRGSSSQRISKVQACDLCRVRKIRCDRSQPACENCHLAGLPCTFTPTTNQQRRGPKQELADANARVKELEAILASGSVSVSGTTSSVGSSASPSQVLDLHPTVKYLPDAYSIEDGLASFQWHIIYCGLGHPLSAQRAEFYSIIEKAGCTFELDDFLHKVRQSFRPVVSKELTVHQMKVPSLELVQLSIHHYEKAGLYSMFPFADVEAMQMLITANVLSNHSSSRAAHRACLIAFTANISQMHRHEPVFRDAEPYAYAQYAISLIPELLMEPPDLRSLEAVLMLAAFIAPIGQPQTAEMLLGIAVQMVYTLGGHKAHGPRHLQGKWQHLRALFWMCYGMDKEFSIRKNQPPLIKGTDCDLDLPQNYVSKLSDQHFYWKPLSSKELLYPSDLRINMLKAQVYDLLHSPHSHTHSEARRLQNIRELDDKISALKAEIPVHCRPETFATEDSPDYLFHDLSIRGVSIHLEYYYLLGKIHQTKDSPQKLSAMSHWSSLSSSAEICYEAARSTLIYIRRVRHYINYHTFWIHAQFILTAVITLFRFLLLFPTLPTFHRDVELLENVATMFTELGTSHDDEKQSFPPFYIMETFIRQLAFMARKSLEEHMKRLG